MADIPEISKKILLSLFIAILSIPYSVSSSHAQSQIVAYDPIEDDIDRLIRLCQQPPLKGSLICKMLGF